MEDSTAKRGLNTYANSGSESYGTYPTSCGLSWMRVGGMVHSSEGQ